MQMHRFAVASLALVLTAGLALAEEGKSGLKSGPQTGEELAGPFHPLNINGSQAGKKHCLYCSNGDRPVAMIFARQVSPELSKLVSKIDAACAKHSSCKMSSFVVFCNSDEALEGQLKQLAKDKELKSVVLSIDNPAGPEGYKVAKDADVTVVLYVDRTVKANYAFKKGSLKDKDIETIVSKGVPAILPK